jgi:hypothetical protein
MLAAQLPIADIRNVGAVPLPPVPEQVESRKFLERLAELRRDDLLDGGRLNPSDVGRAMTVVAEIAQRYAQLYESWLAQMPEPQPRAESSDNVSEVSASDVIYGLMSEQQRLAELAKLAGQLRYGVDGGDARQVEDTATEIGRLGAYLPASYRLVDFVAAARQPGPVGRELATLFLDRCFKLSREEYSDLPRIDREIERLRERG